MNKVLDGNLTAELRSLYADDSVAQAIFDWFASRQNDAKETPVDRAASKAECEYSDAYKVFKELDKIGVGRLIVGRKTYKTRMEWHYSIRSVGHAAQGGSEPLAEIDPDLIEDWPDDGDVAEPEGMLKHEFQLRADLKVAFELPEDLTSKEAERLSAFIRSLPFE